MPLAGAPAAVPRLEAWSRACGREAAVARPLAAWWLAWVVCPGRDPAAAAAAVPTPKAATVAAAANLAVRTLDSIAFLLEGGRWQSWTRGEHRCRRRQHHLVAARQLVGRSWAGGDLEQCGHPAKGFGGVER